LPGEVQIQDDEIEAVAGQHRQGRFGVPDPINRMEILDQDRFQSIAEYLVILDQQ